MSTCTTFLHRAAAYNCPLLLFKYREWRNPVHQTMLTQREVYFASPKDFEDRMDCSNTISKFTQEEKDRNFMTLCERFGVLSLSKVADDSYLFEKYADSSQGFMVAFDGQVLCTLANAGGDVIYYDTLPKVDVMAKQSNVEYFVNKYLSKHMCYNKEKEYRLFKCNMNGLTFKQRKVVVPVEAYKYIVIGRNMSRQDEQELRKSLPIELKKLPIYHSQISNP